MEKIVSKKVAKSPRLAIYNTFKTGPKRLTGEAKRQRMIITILAERAGPAERTRTSIAHRMADAENLFWRDIYSGIFRDLDEVLLPMGVVREEGRLPPKRGPRALRERGIPYYRLTKTGALIALSLDESGSPKGELLKSFFGDAEPEQRFAGILAVLSESSPAFVRHIMQMYVRAFCEGAIKELLPFDLARLRVVHNDSLRIQREVVEAFAALSKPRQDEMLALLREVVAAGGDDDGNGGGEGGDGGDGGDGGGTAHRHEMDYPGGGGQ